MPHLHAIRQDVRGGGANHPHLHEFCRDSRGISRFPTPKWFSPGRTGGHQSSRPSRRGNLGEHVQSLVARAALSLYCRRLARDQASASRSTALACPRRRSARSIVARTASCPEHRRLSRVHGRARSIALDCAPRCCGGVLPTCTDAFHCVGPRDPNLPHLRAIRPDVAGGERISHTCTKSVVIDRGIPASRTWTREPQFFSSRKGDPRFSHALPPVGPGNPQSPVVCANSVPTDHRTLDLLHLDGVRPDE